MPRHYLIVVGLIGLVSAGLVRRTTRRQPGRRSWHFFLLGAGFMVLETGDHAVRAAVGFHLVVASLAIASVLIMALAANLVVAKDDIRRPWLVCAALPACSP